MHLYTCVSEEGGNGEAPRPETPSLLSYTLRCISFTEVGNIYRVALREPMHLCTCVREDGDDGEAPSPETPSLCTCVSEKGDNGEDPSPETPSLLSHTLRYISFARVANSTGSMSFSRRSFICLQLNKFPSNCLFCNWIKKGESRGYYREHEHPRAHEHYCARHEVRHEHSHSQHKLNCVQ